MYEMVTSEVIRQLFLRGAQAHVLIEDGHLNAYLVTEVTRKGDPVLHFAWVRQGRRKNGLMLKLLKHVDFDINDKFFYTFQTKYTKKRMFKNGVYCPEIARRKVA